MTTITNICTLFRVLPQTSWAIFMGKLPGCLLAISVALTGTVTAAEQSPQKAEAEILDQILDILNNLPASTSGPADLDRPQQSAIPDTPSAHPKTSGQAPKANVDISILPPRPSFEIIIPKPPSSLPSPSQNPGRSSSPANPSGSVPSNSSGQNSKSSSPTNPSGSAPSNSSGQNSKSSGTSNQRSKAVSNSSSTAKPGSGQASTNSPVDYKGTSTAQQNGKNNRGSSSASSQNNDDGKHSASNTGNAGNEGTSNTSQDPFPVFTDPEESRSAQGSRPTQPQKQSDEGSFDAILADLELSILEHVQQGISHIPSSGGLSNPAGNEDEENQEDSQGGAGGSSNKTPPWQPAPLPSDSQTAQASQRGQSGSRSTGPSNKEQEIPDDLKDINNDDIVARQLKEAALAEIDPELREKLWQEYRKYKGL